MNRHDLSVKWSVVLSEASERGYRSIILDPAGRPELYLAISEKSERCLILRLPKESALSRKNLQKDKVSLIYYAESNYVVLSLLDDRFNELFDDLVVSIYSMIKDVNSADEYADMFYVTFHKWIQLFEEASQERLSSSEIQGLFGELVYLNKLIDESDSSNVNDVIKSWQGPYGNSHDFLFEELTVEVKTKLVSSNSIEIASEYQLDDDHGRTHRLLVYSIDKDIMHGESIGDLVKNISRLIYVNLADNLLLQLALRRHGLTFANISEYDNYRYKVHNETMYDCMKDGFPSIIKSRIDERILNVKYSLSLSNLDSFIVMSRHL